MEAIRPVAARPQSRDHYLLISLYRQNELPFHLKLALQNGVTKDEIIGVITHLAFYGGWPVANTALTIARKAFQEASV